MTLGHAKYLEILLADSENGLLVRGKASSHLTPLAVPLTALSQHGPSHCPLTLESSDLERNVITLWLLEEAKALPPFTIQTLDPVS